MMHKILLLILATLTCYSATFSNVNTFNNNFNTSKNQKFNNKKFNNQQYLNSQNFIEHRESNNNIFIGTEYGFGIKPSKKNYISVFVLNRLSKRAYMGIEIIGLQEKTNSTIAHTGSFILGNHESMMAHLLSGSFFKPSESTFISLYFGAGSTIKYTNIGSLGTITSGINIGYSVASFASLSLGYKNIAILTAPMLNIENYATASMTLSF